jgi:hypothetical protein
VLKLLKAPSTRDEMINKLLSQRILDAKGACKIALKSLNNKKLIRLSDKKMELTDTGIMQREVLLKAGIISDNEEVIT